MRKESIETIVVLFRAQGILDHFGSGKRFHWQTIKANMREGVFVFRTLKGCISAYSEDIFVSYGKSDALVPENRVLVLSDELPPHKYKPQAIAISRN